MGEPLRVMLVAGEVSGDRLGARLMAALREMSPREVEFVGVGGGAMAAEGLESLHDIADTAVVGVRDVVARLPLLLRRIRETAAFALQVKPDVLVLVDSPDFTHRVARRVRAGAPGLPIVAYVAPSVWAWRRGRAKRMRKYVDKVLAVLPFEEEVFRAAGGPECAYVGHPALDEVPAAEEGVAFRRELGIAPGERVVALLPGSRRGEVARHAARFVEVGRWVSETVGGVRLVMLGREELRGLYSGGGALVFGEAARRGLFAAADAALVAVGTASLELGLARVPMVVGLREHAPHAWVAARVLRVPSLCLVNLVLDAPAMRECLQEELRVEVAGEALREVLVEGEARAAALAALDAFCEAMGVRGERPAARAARVVLETAGVA